MSYEPEESKKAEPQTLSYRSPQAKVRPRSSYQLLIGALSFFAWLLLVITMVVLFNQIKPRGIDFSSMVLFLGIALIGLLLFCFEMHRRGWKSFFPGVLIAFGLSILIGCGLCAIMLQNLRI